MEQDIQDPREREIRRQFLDEAQAYWVTLEASVLGLAGQRVDLQKINAAMRAAHSIKGGAAMMGYQTLSEFAHRLEDSFKVLKTKQQSLIVSDGLEQRLLRCVDYLQQVIETNRQAKLIDPQWLAEEATPLFEQLRGELGEAEEESAASVLGAEDGGQALLAIVFGSEVEEMLLRLEGLLTTTAEAQLRDEVMTLAGELGGLGEMLQLPSFTRLCESVLEALDRAEQPTQVIAQSAQIAWRQSQALVLAQQPNLISTQLPSPSSLVQEERSDFPLIPLQPPPLEPSSAKSFVAAPTRAEETAGIAPRVAASPRGLPELPQLVEEEAAFLGSNPDAEPNQLEAPSSVQMETTSGEPQEDERTVRVSLKRVEQLNDLFGELTIERNALALYCDRLRSLTQLLKQRVNTLNQNNQELQTSYNELAGARAAEIALGNETHGERATGIDILTPGISSRLGSFNSQGFQSGRQGFDRLEMDQYDSLSLQSQGIIETIVQVQEVTTDIDLSLEETDQTLRNLHKTTKHLRNQLTHLRMRPLTDVLDRFPRALRALGLEHGKQVSLDLQGSNTLVDRNVLEALQEPLMHLLRNAFDHGLESPEERFAQGKPAEGKITIRAVQQGNRTVIEFEDDGRGINIEKVRAKAAAMGLDGELLATASEQELLSLIFEPGFSTSSQVTALSGRGVGMDVVRDRLKPVRGEIKVATRPGQGTVFTLSVPFSLAVLRVQVVESQGMLLAIPADSITEVVLVEQLPEWSVGDGQEKSFRWNGEIIRWVSLAPWLQFHCPRQPYSLEANPKIDCPALLLLDNASGAVAVEIERSWGEQEVAIRQVEGQIAMPTGFSNCSIMGDGRVIPLVNLADIIQGQLPDLSVEDSVSGAFVVGVSAAIPVPFMPPVAATKPTVLVVDDSINVRRFLALTLEKAGYRVEQAKDGLHALEMLSASLPVQAIICDIEMPRLDGYGVLAKVKADPAMAHLPIAMLTSRSGEKHRKLAIDLGASAYFSKPYNERELLEQLESMLVAA